MTKILNWYRASFAHFHTSGAIGLLILRLVFGLALAQHGFGKMQAPTSWMGPDAPVPGFFQFLAAFSEFGGGIAWALGLLTPIASFGIIVTMVVAVFHHFTGGQPWVAPNGGGSFEPAMGYLVVGVFLLLNGPGPLSLDRKVFK